jgi:predicted NBD/HSP70 family sugar kinase
MAPDPAPRDASANGTSAGNLLQLIQSEGTVTRGELVRRTGLARSTITQRVDALIELGLVEAVGESASTGGRPPKAFAFNPKHGVVCAADLGATHSQLAIADLAGTLLAKRTQEIDIALGPEHFVGWLTESFTDLLGESGYTRDAIRGVGVGLPGPVEFATGRPVNPPIMPGWNDFPAADRLRETLGAPALVDNDVNIMALGEHWASWPDEGEILYIKVGTGIGCGVISGGQVHRGHQGAAGDIGHIQVVGHDDVLCDCGNRGCLEAIAGGRAMAKVLREAGFNAETSLDVVELCRQGEPAAVQLIRQAGRLLGEVLAAAVNLLNPGVIVIGGDVANADDHLIAGVRERVYQRSTPLATKQLRILRSELGEDAGITGAVVMSLQHVLAPPIVDQTLAAAGAR